jgi:tetratricopeptide (TPR) repeat protein
MKKMTYWWARLSPWMKLALPVGILWLLIVAGSALIFDFWSRGWQAWADLIGAAFLASLVIVRTLIYIRDRLPGPKIRPAKEDELLIVVAKFRGPESPDPQMYITRRLEADLLMHPALADKVRVSRFPEAIEEESQEAEIEKVRAIGETYGATLVIWGEHDGHSAAPHYLVTRESERVSTVVELKPTVATADLDEFVMYISEELPETVTYLSFFTIGQMYYFENEYPQALSLFCAAVDNLPSGEAYKESGAALHFYRGNTYFLLGKSDLAMTDYDKAIELKPDLAKAYNNRGTAYHYKGDYNLAIADCDKAIELRPDYAEAYVNRGNAYNRKGEHDLAIADCNKAIELRPDLAVAHYNRGVAYEYNIHGQRYGKGAQLDRAIADYDKVIELKPDCAEAYYSRGVVYHTLREHGQAIADYNRATGTKGEDDLAIADFSKAIGLKPDYTEAYYNRGISYAQKREYDLAIADYDRAIELRSNLTEAYYNHGLTYADKTIELVPDLAEAYYNRGVAHKMRGDREKAIRDFERFLELREDKDSRREAEEHLRELKRQ